MAALGVFATAEVLAQAAPLGQSQSSQAILQPMGQQPELQLDVVFSPWTKFCNQDPDPNSKRICVTVKDGRRETGELVISVAVIERDGEAKKLLRVSFPYEVALQHGTRMIVDQRRPAIAPYLTCLPPTKPPGGCIADYELTPDVLEQMKKGQVLTVQAIHTNGQPISPRLDLEDFVKAYDGPPSEPAAFRLREQRIQDDRLQPHLRPKN